MCKLYRPVFFAFYNISQPNFAILPTLGRSFNAGVMNFTISIFLKNFVYNAIGPFTITDVFIFQSVPPLSDRQDRNSVVT